MSWRSFANMDAPGHLRWTPDVGGETALSLHWLLFTRTNFHGFATGTSSATSGGITI